MLSLLKNRSLATARRPQTLHRKVEKSQEFPSGRTMTVLLLDECPPERRCQILLFHVRNQRGNYMRITARSTTSESTRRKLLSDFNFDVVRSKAFGLAAISAIF